MFVEILIAFALLIVSFLLIYTNIDFALVVLLFLSTLLHKELFSIYRWDVLPVRIFMLAFLGVAVLRLGEWLLKKPRHKGPRTVGMSKARPLQRLFRGVWKEPFILLLLLLWLVRGVSIMFSKNLFSSITLFGFFTTIVSLGIVLYKLFAQEPERLFKYIKLYIFIIFGLCIFAYLQAFLYLKYEIIIGALWNVPGNFPRLGATFWDVNHFGALIAGFLPVIGVLILTVKGLKQKAGYFVIFALMMGVLLLTNSRTAWIIAFVSFMTFVALFLYKKFKFKGIGVLVLVVLLAAGLFVREYSDRSSPIRRKVKDYFHYRIDSFDSHFMLLKGAWQIFEKYPFLGGGYGGFFEHFAKTEVSAQYFGRDPAALNTRVPAHTIWGELLAETGAIGFVVFTALLFLILSTLLYLGLKSKSVKDSLMGSAMFSAVLGWFVAGIFYSYKSEFFWLVLFMYFVYAVGKLGEKYTLENLLALFVRSKWFPTALLFVISALLIFVNLGANHLIPWDEAIYAKVAKNMLEFKRFVMQTWWPVSDPWYEKPPLYMWLMAMTMKLFGFNGWGARVPSAFFGLSTVFLVYFFVKKFFNKIAAFMSAISLLTTFHFLYYSRIGMLDVTVTFFITLALCLYYLAKEKEKLWCWVLGGIACGFAVMTKGVIGLLPFPIIFLYESYLFLAKKQCFSKALLRNYFIYGFCSIGVFLPWHFEMYRRFGKGFVNTYFGYHVLSRAIEEIEDKGRSFWWYVLVMKVSMRIWFVALVGALPFTLYQVFKKSGKHVFLVLWGVFIFVFFSVARSKLVWYIIPIYPVTSIMIGTFVERSLHFVLQKSPKLDNIVVKSLVLCGFTVISLFYLFLNKDLVYRIDLTGPQAKLMQLKNDLFDDEEVTYVDRVELPLVLFYLKGPFVVVDFGPLREKIMLQGYDEHIIFITKESRFRTLKKDYEKLELTAEEKEWVLGYASADYDFDKNDLEDIEKILNRVIGKISNLEKGGEAVPFELLRDKENLLKQIAQKKQEIELKMQGF